MPVLELDDRLPHAARREAVAGAGRQALHRRRHRRQVLGVLARQVLRGGDEQAVAGEDHGPAEVGQPVGEIVEQPGKIS